MMMAVVAHLHHLLILVARSYASFEMLTLVAVGWGRVDQVGFVG
jgi:hypothetical protein